MSLIAAALLAGGQPLLAKAGDCSWVRGRYAVYNGSGVHRIWMIGTTHMLSLDVGDEAIPPQFQRFYDTNRFQPLGSRIFGDFYVCAVERRIPGHQQHVHLEKTKNLRIVTYPLP